MSRIRFRHIAFMFVLALALAVSATAFAAETTSWERVEITLHDDPSGDILLVGGQLPETAKLPADVSLAVPAGATLQWAGELLGGAPENDPTVETKVTKVGAMDVYSFRLTKSRLGQIEVVVPDAYVAGATGNAAVVKYVATSDVPEVAVSVRVPGDAEIKEPLTGAELVEGPAGYRYYQRISTKVKAGDDLGMAFAYTGGAAPAASAAAPVTGGANNSWIYVLLAVLFAIAAFAVFKAVRGQIPAETEYEAEEEAEDETAADESIVIAEESEADDESDESPEGSPAPKSRLRPAITFAVIAVFVVMAVVVANITSKPTVAGGTVTKVYAGGDPCVTATIPLALSSAKDPGQAANVVLEALQPEPGLKSATVDIDAGTIQIGFCESQNSEKRIREVLATTGLLAEGSSAPAPAPAPAPSADSTAPAK